MGGGCINPSARIRLEDGREFFLKWNDAGPGMFAAEARGLRALAEPDALRVPDVAAVGDGRRDGIGWLLLEFLERGPPGPDYDERLGRGLALLHDAEPARPWGWSEDNWIGSLPQSNRTHESWADFWLEERLEPQLRMARDRGWFSEPSAATAWQDLFLRLPEMLEPAMEAGPSLLHGDLWSGNVFPGPDGQPVVIDPAVYVGHGEVDLAMTELFGGFGRGFYRAYDEIRPSPPGYPEVRRHLYQLYPLLVHVNLFGGGYEVRAMRALRSALSGVS